MTDIILASGSPRRKELLKQMNVPFTVIVSEADESLSAPMPPEETVKALAVLKAEAVAKNHENSIVIGADTIVALDGNILGKPKDRRDAERMLVQLSGREHSVYTGVAMVKGKQKHVFYQKTNVTFWELSHEEIAAYLDSGEPFDKAGAYGIQGLGAAFVKHISGDYFSVVGLPIASVYRQLKRFGWNGPACSSSSQK
ncbi:Maf family protein [Bacillus xiapuensis]|uniref:Maf family protein n=1 Tax=Bacillus xiapuensis TaxID=2014075 RepID=UPI000C233AFF|nr:Maf family protein [Bacillus xiapuensis]